MQNPDLFVHVSTPSGIHRVPRAVAERAGWRQVGETDPPRERASKPRKPLVAADLEPRGDDAAATPTTTNEESE